MPRNGKDSHTKAPGGLEAFYFPWAWHGGQVSQLTGQLVNF